MCIRDRLNIDPIDRMVIVTGIPNNAQATVNIKTGTISELYDYGGAPMAVRAVQNLFFITIDRYIRVDNESLAQIVDMLGGVEDVYKRQWQCCWREAREADCMY